MFLSSSQHFTDLSLLLFSISQTSPFCRFLCRPFLRCLLEGEGLEGGTLDTKLDRKLSGREGLVRTEADRGEGSSLVQEKELRCLIWGALSGPSQRRSCLGSQHCLAEGCCGTRYCTAVGFCAGCHHRILLTLLWCKVTFALRHPLGPHL